MIGALLDSLFSGENLKRIASFIFIIHIIVGIILGGIIGEDIDRDYKIIGAIIGLLVGGGIGLTEAFIWHVLGQILSNLNKIRYATKATMIAVVKSYLGSDSTAYRTECQNIVSVARNQNF